MEKNISIPEVSEKAGALLQVIAPTARIAILLSIGGGEACVCHLEASLGWRQAYISQHLMALRKADILQDRREGRYVYYRLANESVLDLLRNAARLTGIDLQNSPLPVSQEQASPCACPHCSAEPADVRIIG